MPRIVMSKIKIVQLVQITGNYNEYNEEEINVLSEILVNNYKGEIKLEDEEMALALVSFTYPYNHKNQRGKDGQTYLWVNQKDIEEIPKYQ